MRTRLTMLAVVLGFAASSALAQDLNTDQIIKYYRKKNNVPPASAVTVTGRQGLAHQGRQGRRPGGRPRRR